MEKHPNRNTQKKPLIPVSERRHYKNQPLVSVHMMSYNHEKFIGKAIQGVLSQQVNFPVEIVISDDCSTDNTQKIIMEYAERYPGIVKPVLRFKNLGGRDNFRDTFDYCHGKYIAICEGDDYWVHPQKLQKQVDFLESHPDFTMTCGGFRSLQDGEVHSEFIEEKLALQSENEEGFEFDLDSMKNSWLTKTLTLLFRKSAYKRDEVLKYEYFRDVHLNYHLLKTGKGFYFTEIFGVYNMHEGGVHSLVSANKKFDINYKIYKELYEANHDDYTRFKLVKAIAFKLQLKENKNIKLLLESLRYLRSSSELKFLLKNFVKNGILENIFRQKGGTPQMG